MRWLAVALAVPTLLVGWLHVRDERLEARLGEVASGVARRDVSVDCQGLFAALLDAQAREGEVRFAADGTPEPLVFLTRPTCSRLRAFADGKRGRLACLALLDWTAPTPLVPGDACYDRASPDVYALLVLAHEAYHTAGVTNEAATNCYAIQAMAWTAERLGARPAEAALAARAMAALAPLQRGVYATSECRPGARLDLTPQTPEFPTEPGGAPPPAPPR
jgi:hypothetical protein